MTPDQQKQAMKMYKRYQCETREYRELAESMRMNTGELNLACWRILHASKGTKQ